MIDALSRRTTEQYPSVEALLTARKWRTRGLAGGALLLALLVSAASSLINPAVAAALIVLIALPVVLWFWPETALYISVAGAALFETMPRGWPDETTGLVPWFWNITTVTQRFLRVGSDPLYVNLFELFLVMAAVITVSRAIIDRRLRFRVGVLFWPILVYLLFVSGGIAHGLWMDGDTRIALWESRGQFYIAAVYLLAYNSLKDERSLRILVGVLVGCSFVKGLQALVRYYVFLGGSVPSQQGLLSHDQAIFQTSFFLLLVLMTFGGLSGRTRMWALLALPLEAGGMLLNQRRLGTAAVVVALAIAIPLIYLALKDRRRLLLIWTAVGLAITPIYLRWAWNKTGALAEPARAIRSKIEPDYRDQQSDDYRATERYNLIQTIRRGGLRLMAYPEQDPPWHDGRLTPWIGLGYGRKLGQYTYMPDLEKIDPFIHYRTHDSLLWVWARLGTGGFAAFWLMIVAALLLGGQALRRVQGRTERLLLIWAICMVFAFLIVARYDMGAAEYRPLIVAGLAMGIISALWQRSREQEEAAAVELLPAEVP